MKILLLFGAVFALLAALFVSPVSAEPYPEGNYATRPYMVQPYPFQRNASYGINVALEAPKYAYGLRPAIEWMDSRVGSVNVHTEYGITSSSYSRAHHVKLKIINDPNWVVSQGAEAPQAGTCYWWTNNPRIEVLNKAAFEPGASYEGYSQFVAMHEFGHCLGLGDMWGAKHGLMSAAFEVHPSSEELLFLQNYYASH